MRMPPADKIAPLEARLASALQSGDISSLVVLGYGEISCVLRLEWESAGFACKRLPGFNSKARFQAYSACFDEYLKTLADRGIDPVQSELVALSQPSGEERVYCVQPELPSWSLLPSYMRSAGEAVARDLFLQIIGHFESAVTGDLGVDGQLSNWALVDGKLLYLDVTTPLLRDANGKERLDTDLFLASLPYILRFPVKKLLLGKILNKYYEPRGIVVDLLGNLLKERLEHLLPVFLKVIKQRFAEPITDAEVRAYYEDDAKTWALLQRLRRMDRFWQQKIRRRTYPFLLPGPIQR